LLIHGEERRSAGSFLAKHAGGFRRPVDGCLNGMDFTIALKKREVEQAASLQSRLRLQTISLYKSEAAEAASPLRAVEPVRLSAELDSEINLQDSAGVDFAVTLRVVSDDALVFHIEATFLARYQLVDRAKEPFENRTRSLSEESRGSCGLALYTGIRANHRCPDGLSR
jgi:hypothetical protein